MDLVPDDHDPAEDGHYIELRLDFHPPAEDAGPTLAQVQMHSHHIPDNLYVDTLLILARDAMVRTMAENMFKESVPTEVRAFAARMMANRFLMSRLESNDLGSTEAVNFTVPDDASELFDSND